MARVAGVTIPTDKRVVMSLTYIHGVGPTTSKKILSEAEVSEDIRVKDLSEPELKKIRDYIGENLTVEGELQRRVRTNIKRLRDINSYRGLRHSKNLPSRGQRTKTNARTRRGKRIAVGGVKPKAATKT
jgi:small subunit ribosomal protein S13